jgi:hypothetical protein
MTSKKKKKKKGPSNAQLDKMISKAQSVLDKAQAALDGGLLSAEEVAEAHQTIDDMVAKIAKLTARKKV